MSAEEGKAEPTDKKADAPSYRPDTELLSHYADASLVQQFDAFVWFDETPAVPPLGPEHAKWRSGYLPVRPLNRHAARRSYVLDKFAWVRANGSGRMASSGRSLRN